MSLSRTTEDGDWFDCKPGYVYVRSGELTEYEFNIGIRTPKHFAELAMRALDQSDELSDEQLKACEQAFRERFNGMLPEEDNE